MTNQVDVKIRDEIAEINRHVRELQNLYGSRTAADDAMIRLRVNELRAKRANLQSELDSRTVARRG